MIFWPSLFVLCCFNLCVGRWIKKYNIDAGLWILYCGFSGWILGTVCRNMGW